VSSTPEPSTPEPRFEDALAELEQLVGRLERGETGLEEALAAWERGEELVRGCLAKLDAAQGRIEQLGAPAPGAAPDDEPDA
jgi:exodeoxyribonuclease VII small subunit